MATIKLGNTTLAGFAFGGKTQIVTPTEIKKIVRTPQITQAASIPNRIIPTFVAPPTTTTTTTTSTTSTTSTSTTTTTQLQTNWLLLNSIWNDSGVWDDTQSWSDGTSNWLLSTGNWDDNGFWDDTQIWN